MERSAGRPTDRQTGRPARFEVEPEGLCGVGLPLPEMKRDGWAQLDGHFCVRPIPSRGKLSRPPPPSRHANEAVLI